MNYTVLYCLAELHYSLQYDDYTTIINGSTVPLLENILNWPNLPSAGTIVTLKLRLEEAIQSPDMDQQVIANAFVQHARGVVNGDDIVAESDGQGDAENENQSSPVTDNEAALNQELASLQRVLAKKKGNRLSSISKTSKIAYKRSVGTTTCR